MKSNEEEIEETERLIDLYTYQCADGMVRTRCRRHIATEGPYRMLGKQPYHVKHKVAWSRCVECYETYLWMKEQEKKDIYEQVTDIDQ